MATKFLFFINFLLLLCLAQLCHAAADKIPEELIGRWSEQSLTALKNGKPFGTVNFKPHQASITFNADGTWIINTTIPTPHKLNGVYEIHGQDLDMKWADGEPYSLYQFRIDQGGKQLVMENKEHRILAVHE